MKKEYEIKGIEKIIEKVGKEQLAKYYEVEQDADFKELITETLRQIGVPNGLEIATYEVGSMEEIYKGGYSSYADRVYEKCCKDNEKGLEGINFNITGNIGDVTDLFFYIDEPIKQEEIENMSPKISIGGVQVSNYRIRKKIL